MTTAAATDPDKRAPGRPRSARAEQAIITAASIPLGFVFGYFISLLSNNLVDTEMLRLPIVFSARTFVVTGVLTVVAAIISGLLVGWRINNLDLVAVLKTRE